MKKTSRGFSIYSEFNEKYGNRVRVIESSLAESHCVWIFCNSQAGGEEAILLNRQQAKWLIRALEKFLESE